MHSEAKARIVAAVDKLVASGVRPDQLALHPDTARDAGLHGTHLDLGNERLFQDAAAIARELAHPDYDRNPARDDQARPKSEAEASALAAGRCEKHMRRPGVVLAVELDPSVPVGKYRVTGAQRIAASEEQ